ncbi:MAG: MFS transporter [Theionarchaea archaeon]|nr:MFS transporter [Theionarchaea archaeon]
MARIKEEIIDYKERIASFSKNSKVFLLSHALNTVSMGIFTVILNLYILELGFSTQFLGLIISSHLVLSSVFLLPGGAISDRIGRKNTFLLSTVIMGISIFMLSTTQQRLLLIVANSLRGMSTSLSNITVDPFMMEQSDHYERMHLFSFSAALQSFSRMIGSLIGGILPTFFAFYILDLSIQYQYTLMTAGGFSLVALIPIIFIKEVGIRRDHESTSQSLFSGKRLFIIKFAVCSMIIGFGAGVIVPFFNVYFAQELHATAAQIGVIFSAGELTMAIASLALPFVVRKFGKVGSTVITQFLSIPFLLLIMLTHRLVYAFFGFFMRMTLMNMSHPAQKNFYMDEIPEHERGKANSVSQFGSTFSRALGSDLGGYLIATGTFNHAFQVTTIIYIIGTALFYFFFKSNESSQRNSMEE